MTTSADNGKTGFPLNGKFLLISGCVLLAVTVLMVFFQPWTWENIEKIRHCMHREMNGEVYGYYFSKIRTLLSLSAFAALGMIGTALTLRFVPRPCREKIFPILADEKYSGFSGALVIFILAAGVFVRLDNYLFHHFWCDTLALSDAVWQTPFSALLTGPLPNMQSAPPAFLAIAKGLGEIFGYRELVLGFPSFAAGIIALFLFYRLIKTYFRPEVVPVMLFLFAFNPAQIYYSGEFKQYAFDVLFTILLLDLGLRSLHDHSGVQMVKTALAGAAALLFSHAVFFVIPPLGASLFFHSLVTREKPYIVRMTMLNLIWVAVLLGAALYALHVMPGGMYEWHRSYFAPVPLDREGVLWYARLFRNIFCFPHGLSFRIPLLNIIPFALILAGCVRLWKKDRWFFVGAIFPLVLLWLASLLKQYPIESHENTMFSRLILFTTPPVFFIYAAGLDWLCAAGKKIFCCAALYAVGITVLLFLATFTIRWDIGPLHRQLVSGIAPGDHLYTTLTSQWYIHIHSDADPLPVPQQPFSLTVGFDCIWDERIADAAFKAPGRYWIFVSQVANGGMLKSHLEKIGDVQVWSEAGGFLYRLDKKQP